MPQLERQREKGMRASAEAGRRINENSRHSGRDDDAEGGRHIRYFISRVSLCLRPPSPQQHIPISVPSTTKDGERGWKDGRNKCRNKKRLLLVRSRGRRREGGTRLISEKATCQATCRVTVARVVAARKLLPSFFGPVLFPYFLPFLSGDQRYHTPIITCLCGLRSRSPSGRGGRPPSGNGEVYKRPVTKKCRTEGRNTSRLKQGIGKR